MPAPLPVSESHNLKRRVLCWCAGCTSQPIPKRASACVTAGDRVPRYSMKPMSLALPVTWRAGGSRALGSLSQQQAWVVCCISSGETAQANVVQAA
jgi:hypothetical protein